MLHAKHLEVNFKRVITIGRQMLYVKENALAHMLVQAGLSNISGGEGLETYPYAESFFHKLGAEVVDSLDASTYEDASIIHDLNQTLPPELHGKYTVLIDGGSLEHVFNFPLAVRNCMELLENQGYYIGITPANNFLGHGFYQFSPELYYRVFSPENGFEMLKMYLYEDHKNVAFYEVPDPMELKQRVTMANASSSYLFVLAQKKGEKEPFKITPQQSDYEHIVWTGGSEGRSSAKKRKPTKTRMLFALLADMYKRKLRPMGNSDHTYFRRIVLSPGGKHKK